MTLNRWILLFALLIGSTLVFLSFAPPQTGKWVYMWQGYKKPLVTDNFELIFVSKPYAHLTAPELQIPEDFSGTWLHWDVNGLLSSKSDFKNGQLEGPQLYYDQDGSLRSIWINSSRGGLEIFNTEENLDRRKEFGIPLE